jgi:hypothetical protein
VHLAGESDINMTSKWSGERIAQAPSIVAANALV